MKKKRILFTLLGLILVIAVLAGIKALQIGTMIDQGKKFVPPPETVTTAVVKGEEWESALTAVGSLTAVQGVTVAAEMAGKVVKIGFQPGQSIERGALLVSQDTSSEEAQLAAAVAQARLTRTTLERDNKMLAVKIISQADHDTAVAGHEQAVAQADNVRATINKKNIKAPFSGRLGIRQVNLGQMLREGDPVVTLQSLDPIFADFSLPQQQLAQLRTGQTVQVTCDAVPGAQLTGKITAINPLVDAESRNVKVQATVSNRGERLRPGMFVNVAVGLPVRQKVLVIPATAVLYAPYGDSVFLVVDDPKKRGGKVLRQQFVRLGEHRGDFVAVASGVKEGDTVVTTGVFKLNNGQSVLVDNRLAPPFSAKPKPENN
ncbi:efflux RND transporter periplasmic adaptor subunit [Geomonas sp. RF6]|uniref:efflux RND transporter periplasmic adaptor subunit n=1 Tax=Geomonas sp. RF6 TaxID=2897342 RepID=UPI001E3BFC07|nr:efflux RND transporter periplasmic adaptor subunit [Geomonas sp. RF6]UFS71943.1 efflux RND transporter periplasmic adaptor subunit [Geomonas sp. RF6]